MRQASEKKIQTSNMANKRGSCTDSHFFASFQLKLNVRTRIFIGAGLDNGFIKFDNKVISKIFRHSTIIIMSDTIDAVLFFVPYHTSTMLISIHHNICPLFRRICNLKTASVK